MGAIPVKLHRFGDSNGRPIGYTHYCPGCDSYHGIYVEKGTPKKGHKWTFNGDLDRPTFMPSVRCYTTLPDGKEKTTCHYFIENGMIKFCADSPHALAGKTVPLPDFD